MNAKYEIIEEEEEEEEEDELFFENNNNYGYFAFLKIVLNWNFNDIMINHNDSSNTIFKWEQNGIPSEFRDLVKSHPLKEISLWVAITSFTVQRNISKIYTRLKTTLTEEQGSEASYERRLQYSACKEPKIKTNPKLKNLLLITF